MDLIVSWLALYLVVCSYGKCVQKFANQSRIPQFAKYIAPIITVFEHLQLSMYLSSQCSCEVGKYWGTERLRSHRKSVSEQRIEVRYLKFPTGALIIGPPFLSWLYKIQGSGESDSRSLLWLCYSQLLIFILGQAFNKFLEEGLDGKSCLKGDVKASMLSSASACYLYLWVLVEK